MRSTDILGVVCVGRPPHWCSTVTFEEVRMPKILLVDREPDTQERYRSGLEHAGFTVAVATASPAWSSSTRSSPADATR